MRRSAAWAPRLVAWGACFLCASAPTSAFLGLGRRAQQRHALQQACQRLERDVAEAALAERILLEQLRQMRATSAELRDRLKQNAIESEAALANATAYATRLEREVETLKQQLAEARRELELGAGAAAEARAEEAETEIRALKDALEKSAAELDALRRDVDRAKRALQAERKKRLEAQQQKMTTQSGSGTNSSSEPPANAAKAATRGAPSLARAAKKRPRPTERAVPRPTNGPGPSAAKPTQHTKPPTRQHN